MKKSILSKLERTPTYKEFCEVFDKYENKKVFYDMYVNSITQQKQIDNLFEKLLPQYTI